MMGDGDEKSGGGTPPQYMDRAPRCSTTALHNFTSMRFETECLWCGITVKDLFEAEGGAVQKIERPRISKREFVIGALGLTLTVIYFVWGELL